MNKLPVLGVMSLAVCSTAFALTAVRGIRGDNGRASYTDSKRDRWYARGDSNTRPLAS